MACYEVNFVSFYIYVLWSDISGPVHYFAIVGLRCAFLLYSYKITDTSYVKVATLSSTWSSVGYFRACFPLSLVD